MFYDGMGVGGGGGGANEVHMESFNLAPYYSQANMGNIGRRISGENF